jgi:hypothetical protein
MPGAPSNRAHAIVEHELLVRYLDAWLPAALHGHKRVTYVDSSADGQSAVAAARVIAEFADLLRKHTVTMVVAGAPSPEFIIADPPTGLAVHIADGPLLTALRDAHALGGPTFAWFAGPVAGDLLSTVASAKSAELMLAGSDSAFGSLIRKAGLPIVAEVELVDAAGTAELLLFATAAEKSLERFKDELWALDEYAGIRLRDPQDPQGSLLDISVQPHLGPLRRSLRARVEATGGSTLAELRTFALHETIYRAADATKAVQALITSGMTSREPIGGRLSPDTLIRPVVALADVDE